MNRASRIARLGRIYRGYRRGFATIRHPPLRLWLEVSNRCNLQCTVCPQSQDHTSPRGEMDLALYRSILDQISGRVFDVNLSHRGEPLFHPDLPDMIALARERGIATRLHTNATLLDPMKGEAVLRSGLDLISFSFDGYDAGTYESIRRGACFEESLWNILRFLRRKKEMGRRLPFTILQVIEHEDSDPEAPRRFRERFQGLPLDKLYVKKPHNWAGNVEGVAPTAPGAPTGPCTFPWYSLTILYDGQVVPCPQDWYARIPLGDLRREELMAVWNGDALLDLRRRHAALDVVGLAPCDECDRIRRPLIAGVPVENLRNFAGEVVGGYEWARRLFRR